MPWVHLLPDVPFADPCQVERASYVWLPLLPRDDGLGYKLAYYEIWRPIDFREAARVPVSANASIANLGGNIVPEAVGPSVAGGIGAGPTGVQPTGAAAEVTPKDPPAGTEMQLGCLASLVVRTCMDFSRVPS